MNNLFNQPDSIPKERLIEILIIMADYLSEGEVVDFDDTRGMRNSRYRLEVKGFVVGGLCALIMGLEISRFITPYESAILPNILKEELVKLRGYSSAPSLASYYWFEPMIGRGSKESVLSAQSERLEFLHKVTIKLQNS